MLQVTNDPRWPGALIISSQNPVELAQVPDIMLGALGQPGDVVAGWSLHPSEQDADRTSAYHEELAILGPHALSDVIELQRPRKKNVVWIDRYHLVFAGAPAQMGGPMMGLYVQTKGRLRLFVYPPSSANAVIQTVQSTPNQPSQSWNEPASDPMARYAISWLPRNNATVAVTVPPNMVPHVIQALQQAYA